MRRDLSEFIVQGPNIDLAPEMADTLETGVLLGQNHSFGLVGGRCSAAQAESLLELRESKCYLRLAKTWKEFCPQFLKMSSSQVDRIIHCLQEFGPTFFEMQKLVNISASVYRSIEPAIKDGTIHVNDEVIALDPENSRKVVAAVAQLRQSLPRKQPAAPPTIEERLSNVDKRSEALVAELKQINDLKCQGRNKDLLEVVVQRTSRALDRMKLELGVF